MRALRIGTGCLGALLLLSVMGCAKKAPEDGAAPAPAPNAAAAPGGEGAKVEPGKGAEVKEGEATAKVGQDELAPLENGKVYKDAKHGFSIAFPAAWTVKPGESNTAVAAVEKPKEGAQFAVNANVVTVDLPGTLTPKELVQAGIEGQKQVAKDFKLEEEHYGKIDGTDASWIVSKFTASGMNIESMVFLVPKDKKLYTITCMGTVDQFKDARKTFEGIGASFTTTPTS